MHRVPFTPDLEPTRLLTAYANGIFPMDVDGELCWFSPDPRAVIPLDAFHVPRTLRQTMKQQRFEIRLNADFDAVIRACAERPRDQTWISDEIIAAYTRLHELGFAHSVEAWRDGELAGGLYGVALGGAFFGESMFHRRRDASKAALVGLVERMKSRGYALLDVQWPTPHLRRFGVIEIPRREYLRRLRAALLLKCDFRGEDGNMEHSRPRLCLEWYARAVRARVARACSPCNSISDPSRKRQRRGHATM